MAKLGNITFTPEELTKTFQTYRQQLIVQPMLAMGEALQHMTIRTGIRYRETVSEMSGKFQLGNYKKDKKVMEMSLLKEESSRPFSETVLSRLTRTPYTRLYGALISPRAMN